MTSDAILLFDFDGTVCLGDEPAYDYARRVAAVLHIEDERDLLAAHAAFCKGKPTTASTFDALDPYNAVRRLAADYGIEEEIRAEAYSAARAGMAAGKFLLRSPEGLRELIWSLPRGVETVLVSNAPLDGLDSILAQIKLEGLFDEVIGDADKPDGLGPVLDRLLDGRDPSSLLSIGDIPRNDLAPAVERGCATAYIDRFGRPWPEADASGASIDELYPFIHRWTAERVA
ncbi:haloacid dehalogenase-like hydrolase [Glycomyces sp. L485]|uniref:HAD family hydrolase n=1 Tax=Glycomyces sp. L485 TaxID=2909235 RepID=UPI001F4AEA3E|nr:haloacid dehalogenase-like hydrolase [Glycomyces sp. L485]